MFVFVHVCVYVHGVPILCVCVWLSWHLSSLSLLSFDVAGVGVGGGGCDGQGLAAETGRITVA